MSPLEAKKVAIQLMGSLKRLFSPPPLPLMRGNLDELHSMKVSIVLIPTLLYKTSSDSPSRSHIRGQGEGRKNHRQHHRHPL